MPPILICPSYLETLFMECPSFSVVDICYLNEFSVLTIKLSVLGEVHGTVSAQQEAGSLTRSPTNCKAGEAPLANAQL